MKKLLLLLISFLCLSAYPINMSVGQTMTLSINAPRYLDGCQWTISRPNDVIFTTTPEFYSTSVEIKAIHGFSATSPCVVQCTYYYKELDPVSGRYIYSRTGKEKWNIYVEETPTNDNHGSGTGSAYIKLNHPFLTAQQDNWAGILYPENYNGPQIKWEYNPEMVQLFKADYSGKYPSGAVEVKGLAIGRTNIYCTNQSGGKDGCELNVLPRSSYKIGDIIKYYLDDVVLNFEVLSNSPKKCAINNVWKTKVSQYFVVPEEICDYYITEIGDYAFQKNPYIKVVVLPSNLTYIHKDAFQQCPELESIIFPSSLRIIDEYAFWLSSKLYNVVFNEGLQTIEERAFQGTSLQRIHLQEGLESIGEMAFYDAPCKELIIPSTVREIGQYAFRANDKHAYDTIVSKITTPFDIEETVFNQMTYDNAVLCVPDAEVSAYKSTKGWSSFKHIVGISGKDVIKPTSITLDRSEVSITEKMALQITATVNPSDAYDKRVKWTTSKSEIATVSDNGFVIAKSPGNTIITCTSLADENIEAKCYVTVDKSQSTSNEFTYQGVNYVILDRESKTCQTKPGETWSSPGSIVSGHLIIPQSVVYGNKEYTVTAIGDWSFLFNELTSINLPNTIQTIGEGAFCCCPHLTSVILPSSLTFIGQSAFLGCDLTDIFLPKLVANIGNLAFCCENITNIEVENENEYFSSLDGVLFDKKREALVCFPQGITGDYTIPETVKTIKTDAFESSKISSITLPNSLCTIEEYAFHCLNLTTIFYNTLNPIIGDESNFNPNTYKNAILHVPDESISKMKTTEPWKNFSNIEAYDFNTYPSLNSLSEAIEKAGLLENREYSEPYIIDFEPIVTYTNGAFNYIAYDGLYFLIYKDNLGLEAGQIVNNGWVARLYNYNGLLELVPMDDSVISGGKMVGVPDPVVIENVVEINKDKLSAVVYISNVVFSDETPNSQTIFTGKLGNQSFILFNKFSISSTPAGIYDILAIVGVYYDQLQVMPIKFMNTDYVDEICNEEQAKYYNMQGQRVMNPEKRGIYICKKGQKTDKLIISR